MGLIGGGRNIEVMPNERHWMQLPGRNSKRLSLSTINAPRIFVHSPISAGDISLDLVSLMVMPDGSGISGKVYGIGGLSTER